MKNLAIARRYAKALLLIGKEDGNTETYRAELNGVAQLIAKEQDLEEAVANPLYDVDGRKRVLAAVIEKLELSKVTSSFLIFLFDKGRIGFLQSINDFYQKLADELKGVAHADLANGDEEVLHGHRADDLHDVGAVEDLVEALLGRQPLDLRAQGGDIGLGRFDLLGFTHLTPRRRGRRSRR